MVRQKVQARQSHSPSNPDLVDPRHRRRTSLGAVLQQHVKFLQSQWCHPSLIVPPVCDGALTLHGRQPAVSSLLCFWKSHHQRDQQSNSVLRSLLRPTLLLFDIRLPILQLLLHAAPPLLFGQPRLQLQCALPQLCGQHLLWLSFLLPHAFLLQLSVQPRLQLLGALPRLSVQPPLLVYAPLLFSQLLLPIASPPLIFWLRLRLLSDPLQLSARPLCAGMQGTDERLSASAPRNPPVSGICDSLRNLERYSAVARPSPPCLWSYPRIWHSFFLMLLEIRGSVLLDRCRG
mmetsp:Transcript_1847/g.3249  ORF Transcript_1847/g.3249 Transcript_1847/m.3249 type:complete len:289 (+) Transcript_1847:416-1282(+)